MLDMRRFALVFGIVAILLAAMAYSVLRTSVETLPSTPGAVEQGRLQLQQQLEKQKQTEAQIEKQDWDSIPLLEDVIKAHQQRLEKLSGNSQAGEVVKHDRESIDRLQKRIADLRTQAEAVAQAAEAAAKQAEQSADTGSPVAASAASTSQKSTTAASVPQPLVKKPATGAPPGTASLPAIKPKPRSARAAAPAPHP